MDMVSKIRVYQQSLYNYGFLTLCYLMNEYAEEENYEECQIILDAINLVNVELKTDLPTRFDKNSIDYFKKFLYPLTGTDGSITIGNTHYYAQEIKNKINEI